MSASRVYVPATTPSQPGIHMIGLQYVHKTLDIVFIGLREFKSIDGIVFDDIDQVGRDLPEYFHQFLCILFAVVQVFEKNIFQRDLIARLFVEIIQGFDQRFDIVRFVDGHDLVPLGMAIAWMLKEALRTWYATSTVETAEQGLDAWIKLVREHGPDPMRQALSAFTRWKQEILAFFQFLPTRISNGFVEGKNNRTKTIMRQAYGYRNFQNLRLRILAGGSL